MGDPFDTDLCRVSVLLIVLVLSGDEVGLFSTAKSNEGGDGCWDAPAPSTMFVVLVFCPIFCTFGELAEFTSCPI